MGIDPSLKPLNLNVQKAFDLISKFSMVAQPKGNKPQPSGRQSQYGTQSQSGVPDGS